MTECKTYIIEHVSDFLKVPKEKWDAMLKEFRAALELQYHAEVLIREMKPKGILKVSCLAPFRWIDDGKQDIHINIHYKKEGD